MGYQPGPKRGASVSRFLGWGKRKAGPAGSVKERPTRSSLVMKEPGWEEVGSGGWGAMAGSSNVKRDQGRGHVG